MAKKKIGKKVGDIKVQISYTIIELFSAGLYSSPNKAFEELVSNAYDADAKKVSVFVASDKTKGDATLWVCDNGTGMDVDGLKELWQIGTSRKRDNEDKLHRLQIGKFGIGKLATYVLANKLTYLCKSKKKYFMVSMDYEKIDDKNGITLDELELTEEEAIKYSSACLMQ